MSNTKNNCSLIAQKYARICVQIEANYRNLRITREQKNRYLNMALHALMIDMGTAVTIIKMNSFSNGHSAGKAGPNTINPIFDNILKSVKP
jgi:hypothetical protein